jgi:hypothetical protein
MNAILKRRAVPALVAAAASGLALLLCGCFDVEESVSLQRDLSGKAAFSMTINMEPMVQFVATMQHSMSGQTGDPTPAELDEVRKGMATKKDGSKQPSPAELKAEIEKKLPPGVKVLSAGVDDQATKIVFRFELGFDDVRKLSEVQLPSNPSSSSNAAAGGQPAPNPYEQPFSGLKVVDEGHTLLVTMTAANPETKIKEAAGGQAGPGGGADVNNMITAAFKDARFAFRLDSPFEVVETNATRRDGKVLYWEIKGVEGAANAPRNMMVRFKK